MLVVPRTSGLTLLVKLSDEAVTSPVSIEIPLIVLVVAAVITPVLIDTPFIVFVVLAVIVPARVRFPADVMVFELLKNCTSPVPFGESVRSAFDVVPIVAAAPPPRFKVVESIERIAAASIVARLPALMVVRPDAESVVSLAAIVRVLFPESRVSVFVVDAIVPASVNVRESISRTVPSIDMFPALPSSSIVIEPVPAATSNSAKLIAVAPPLIEVSDVPFRV